MGQSLAGSINIGSSESGKVVLLTDSLDAAAAVGDAAAGSLTIGVSNQGWARLCFGLPRRQGRAGARAPFLPVALAPASAGAGAGSDTSESSSAHGL